MRITIYNDPAGGGIGGAEYCAVVLAAAFSQEHQVRLVHHHTDFTHERILAAFGEDCSHAELQYEAPDPVWHRAGWKDSLSEHTDCLISICHWAPPVCRAERGILYVLFPLFERPQQWPWAGSGGVRGFLRRKQYDWRWRQRTGSYRHVVSISEYTRRWTEKWWGRDSSIIYPPVAMAFPVVEKRNEVIAVGRFCEMKRQLEIAGAFGQMPAEVLNDWKLVCCGNPVDPQYFEQLQAVASQAPIELAVSLPRQELQRRLAASKIFWHAAGYGMDEDAAPGKLEHFGIVTVEAMAAGCVPVVIGKGGQREIVEHGVTGFLCQTLEEMQDYTAQLMRNEDRRRAMSQAARERAAGFSKERFLRQFRPLVNSQNISLAG